MNNFDHMRARLYAAAGLFDKPARRHKLEDLEKNEWSPDFERLMRARSVVFSDEFARLMRNRLIMGALRYSTMAEKRLKPHRWDLLGAMTKKMDLWRSTGNTEALVDAANYLLLEFEIGRHPKRHHSPTYFGCIFNAEDFAQNYQDCGNTDALVAGAVWLMKGFVSGYHPTKHFSALDDAGGHCQQKK